MVKKFVYLFLLGGLVLLVLAIAGQMYKKFALSVAPYDKVKLYIPLLISVTGVCTKNDIRGNVYPEYSNLIIEQYQSSGLSKIAIELFMSADAICGTLSLPYKVPDVCPVAVFIDKL